MNTVKKYNVESLINRGRKYTVLSFFFSEGPKCSQGDMVVGVEFVGPEMSSYQNIEVIREFLQFDRYTVYRSFAF